MANIDKLGVEVKASTAKANAELSKLIKTLDGVVSGFSRITEKELNKFTKAIDSLGQSMQSSMMVVTNSVSIFGEKIISASEALETLSANEQAPEAVSKLGDAFKGLSEVNSALTKVEEFKKTISDSTLVKSTAAVNERIEKFVKAFEKLKSGGLLENTDLFSKLADTMALVAGAGDPKSLQDWGDALQSFFGESEGMTAIVSGIVLAVSNFFAMWENGFSWLNEAVMLFGIALAAIGAVILGAPALVAAAVAGIVALVMTIVIVVRDNWETICQFCTELWEYISGLWEVAAEWFNANVIEPIVGFFQGLFTRVGQIFEGLWIIAEAIWIIASTWFNENVIIPLVGFFQNLWTDISGIFSGLWSDIQEVWTAVSGWFTDTVIEPVRGAFEDACHAIGTFFDGLWSGIKSGMAGAMNAVIGGIETAINWIVHGINKIISGFNRIVSWAAKVADEDWGGVDLVPEVHLSRISGYASGGYPETGQLFLARENGMNEMIGRIGSKSAVANNDQIVQAITNAVAPAVYEAVAAALASGGPGVGDQSVVLEAEFIADSETVYKIVKKGEMKADRRYHVIAAV